MDSLSHAITTIATISLSLSSFCFALSHSCSEAAGNRIYRGAHY